MELQVVAWSAYASYTLARHPLRHARAHALAWRSSVRVHVCFTHVVNLDAQSSAKVLTTPFTQRQWTHFEHIYNVNASREPLSMIDGVFSAEGWCARNPIWRSNAHNPTRNAACTNALTPALCCALHSSSMALTPHDMPPPDALPTSSPAALLSAAQPVAPVPLPGRQHVTSHARLQSRMPHCPCLTASKAHVRSWASVVSCDQRVPGERRKCLCGTKLSGTTKKIDGIELCGRCVSRHYRGLPQLRAEHVHVTAASRPAAAAAVRAPSPPPAVVLLPPTGMHYATRHACSMPSVHHAEAAESLAALAAADATMPDADMTAALLPLDPPLSLINLATQELAAAPAGNSTAAPGLAALGHAGVSSALRSALHVAGDSSTPLSSEHKNRFAERYIHTRIVVDRHTAGAVLYEAFTQPK